MLGWIPAERDKTTTNDSGSAEDNDDTTTVTILRLLYTCQMARHNVKYRHCYNGLLLDIPKSATGLILSSSIKSLHEKGISNSGYASSKSTPGTYVRQLMMF